MNLMGTTTIIVMKFIMSEKKHSSTSDEDTSLDADTSVLSN